MTFGLVHAEVGVTKFMCNLGTTGFVHPIQICRPTLLDSKETILLKAEFKIKIINDPCPIFKAS